MKDNEPRNNREVQENMNTVYTWLLTNNIQPHETVDLNILDRNNILTKPIKLIETQTFLNKIKSKAKGQRYINRNIETHSKQNRDPFNTLIQGHTQHWILS